MFQKKQTNKQTEVEFNSKALTFRAEHDTRNGTPRSATSVSLPPRPKPEKTPLVSTSRNLEGFFSKVTEAFCFYSFPPTPPPQWVFHFWCRNGTKLRFSCRISGSSVLDQERRQRSSSSTICTVSEYLEFVCTDEGG